MIRNHVLHHAHREPTVPDDLYDEVFDKGTLGDWWWCNVEIDGVSHEALHILVPSVGGRIGQGPLQKRGIELIEVYPMHAKNNWANPGPINGWDGNRDAPTLSPSIFVGGGSESPGWHGFFEGGELRNA